MEENNMQPWKLPRRWRRKQMILPVLCAALFVAIAVLAYQGIHREMSGANPTPAPHGSAVVVSEFPAASGGNQCEEAQPQNGNVPWNLVLVNRWNPIPEGYEPDLVDVPGGEQVDRRIYEPLMEMLDAADAEELGPIIVSGYRTQEEQLRIYDNKAKEFREQGYSEQEAAELTQEWVAVPGTSEHQLGLAVDINGASYDVYLWLQANSYRYGFIFRYPGYKRENTGVAEEVWHYRYVGKDIAAEIYAQGLCLEEYIENLRTRN